MQSTAGCLSVIMGFFGFLGVIGLLVVSLVA